MKQYIFAIAPVRSPANMVEMGDMPWTDKYGDKRLIALRFLWPAHRFNCMIFI